MKDKIRSIKARELVIYRDEDIEPTAVDIALFKAGMKEMIETYKKDNPNLYKKYEVWWQDKIKKWGINEAIKS